MLIITLQEAIKPIHMSHEVEKTGVGKVGIGELNIKSTVHFAIL